MADCITSNGVASMMANRNPDSNAASSVSIVVQVRSIYLVYLSVYLSTSSALLNIFFAMASMLLPGFLLSAHGGLFVVGS
jgi:hypothetical protein